MASAPSGAAVVKPPTSGDLAAAAAYAHATSVDDRTTAAWLCAIPCAALVLAVAALLGPSLGALLSSSEAGYTFTSVFLRLVHPEETEHAYFLIALSLPALVALATIVWPRWAPRLPARPAAWGVAAVQAAFAAVAVASYVRQGQLRFGPMYTEGNGVIHTRYFNEATLVVAALLAGAVLVVLRRARLRAAAGVLLRDTRARRVGVTLVAVAATAVWLLHAVSSDGSVANAPIDLPYHLSFPLDEAFAVLNGLTPLVDFSAQYGSLWPFAEALPLLAFGKTVLVFSLTMCTLSGLALLAIFGVLRRVARSALAALLLYLPFLATSLFFIAGSFNNRLSVATFYGTFPLRYAGPYVLAFLTARHIDRGGRARSASLLFLVGGLAILNNGDFGFAALGATVAALLWSSPRLPRPSLRGLAPAAAGLVSALALVSLLTLLRAGSPPHLWRLVDYARLFGVAGFMMLPIPSLLGMHLVMFLTYVAAFVLATTRALRREGDRLLTGMLAWAAIFGFGSAGYYVGRSHPYTLSHLFSVWALTLALLTIAVVRDLAAHPRRRPTIAAVAVLFGVGLCACSLAQTATPWSQIARLDARFVPSPGSHSPRPLMPPDEPRIRAFVASLADGPGRFVVKRGAPVLILLATGHRIADAYGVRDVSPYTAEASIPTVQRINAVIDALERAGGNTVLISNRYDPTIVSLLQARGFRLLTPHGLQRVDPSVPVSGELAAPWPNGFLMKWVDTRHLHPRALAGR